jgi:hypothetical protein
MQQAKKKKFWLPQEKSLFMAVVGRVCLQFKIAECVKMWSHKTSISYVCRKSQMQAGTVHAVQWFIG